MLPLQAAAIYNRDAVV